ncbi:MAG: hypothetical protein R2867_44050 [Caldilineaceae bacterium]
MAACAALCGALAPAAEGGAAEAAPAAETSRLWVILDIDFHDTYNEYTQKALQDYAAEQGWELNSLIRRVLLPARRNRAHCRRCTGRRSARFGPSHAFTAVAAQPGHNATLD